MLIKSTAKMLPPGLCLDEPAYTPWKQHLCIWLDFDFFQSLNDGKTTIVTGHIDTITEDDIKLQEKGKPKFNQEIIITATDLKMQRLAGTPMAVDGVPLKITERYLWKDTMIEGVPNTAIVLGYTNQSWTLAAEVAAKLVCG